MTKQAQEPDFSQQEQALKQLLKLTAGKQVGEGPDRLILGEEMWQLLRYT